MFNSFYGETLKTYQNWVAGSASSTGSRQAGSPRAGWFRAPAVPGRSLASERR